MEKSTKVWIGLILVAIVGFVGFRVTGNAISGPGEYDDFAKCLTDSGAKFYGAYWCPHCSNQKELFGSSIKYVNYIECDPRGNNAQPQACESAGITGYPTWVFADGSRGSGEQSLQQLAIKTGCVLS